MRAETDSRELRILMSRILIPKPILIITTVSPDGLVNAAPFCQVNVVAVQPPLVGVSFNRRGTGEKDTLLNIRATGELVLNLVTERQRELVNLAAAAVPRNLSEVEVFGIGVQPSAVVRPPRLGGSPGQLECRARQILEFDGPEGPGSAFVIADVVAAHIDDARWRDDEPVGFQPLGRLGGDLFAALGAPFTMVTPTWESLRPAYSPVGKPPGGLRGQPDGDVCP